MEILRVRQKVYHTFDRPSVALGNFDGVHVGHQRILSRTVESAHRRDRHAIVYTFDPHPRVVLNKAPSIPRITTFEERVDVLTRLGVDALILAEFTHEFAAQSPDEFLHDIIVEELGAAEIFVGENYRFGKDRAGGVDTLKKRGPELGFRVCVVPSVTVDGERVSSSRIRSHLLKGEIRQANRLLGREFTIEGKVVHGRRRGKSLGFPTANIKPDGAKLNPPDGVYAGICLAQDRLWPSVMNIGRNPTFGEKKVSYEVHLLDFDQDLYRSHLKVYLVDRLRDELTFADAEALTRQIAEDVRRCREILAVETDDRRRDST
jgi:riboflavin kinase/FMN adenylyltransferase